MLGMRNYTDIYHSYLWSHTPLPTLITLVAALATVWALIKGPDILRGLIVFSGLTLVSSLRDPLVSSTKPQWLVMLVPGVASYYYFLPMLAWIAVVIWYLFRLRDEASRRLATGKIHLSGRAIFTSALVLTCVVMLYGIERDWSYPSYTPYHWGTAVSEYSRARPGTKVTIPINPAGWSMTLDKPKASR